MHVLDGTFFFSLLVVQDIEKVKYLRVPFHKNFDFDSLIFAKRCVKFAELDYKLV